MKVFKVVKFDEVERWTTQDWEFVMCVTNSRAETLHCSTPVPMHGCNNNYSSSGYASASREEAVQIHETLFMLSKDKEGVTHAGAMTAERDAAVTAARIAKGQLSGATQQKDAAMKTANEYQQRYDQLNLKLGEEQGRIRKLEGDLGKVRTAFGTKAFEEALK